MLQKQNKSHKVRSLVQQLFCETCSAQGSDIVAVFYCLDCEEPEPKVHKLLLFQVKHITHYKYFSKCLATNLFKVAYICTDCAYDMRMSYKYIML
jgi:hypothetical protein